MCEDAKGFTESSGGCFRLSYSNNSMTVDSKSHVNDSTILNNHYKAIVEGLIDDSIWELCFEMHREAKFGVHNKTTLNANESASTTNRSLEPSGKNGKLAKSIICPICGLSKGTENYTKHLSECGGTRRKAKMKIRNFNESESVYGDFDDEEFDAGKKPKTTKKGRGKQKLPGNSSKSSFNSADCIDKWSKDEKKDFFHQKCGVVGKRSKKLCMNSRKCGTHTEEERQIVRDEYLREIDDDQDNGQIDVDTVDDKSDMPSYSAGDESIWILPAFS